VNYTAAKSYILQALDALPPNLTYHGKHHTLDVLQATDNLCQAENITFYDKKLILTAALLHDSGFLRAYHNHEQQSCTIAAEWLPQFGYTEGDIQAICGMIMATKIPQSPQTPLEAILCDADLDYLGRSDFEPIGNTLFEEMNQNGQAINASDWRALQIRFLESHTYFTVTNQALRSPVKQRHLMQLVGEN
jgi:uncharacterized protein